MSTSRIDSAVRTRHSVCTWALPAAAVLLLICCRGVTAAPGKTAGRTVAPVIAAILEAWDRADAGAIAAQYEAKGDFVSPDGAHAEGRAQIQTFYTGAFARGYAGSHAGAEVAHVRYLSPTVALVDGTWRIEPTATSKVREPEAGLFFAVIHRQGGRWWIAALREQSSARALRELDSMR